jgi:hypothetical protein
MPKRAVGMSIFRAMEWERPKGSNGLMPNYLGNREGRC